MNLTKNIQSTDAQHHIHPFTDMGVLNKTGSMVITDANGVYLQTSDDKQLLDGMAGLWCVNVGYGEERIIDAINEQLHRLSYYNTFFNSTNTAAAQLAKLIAKITPQNITHSFFTNSGSEANDSIIRLVRHYWHTLGKPNKQVFIARKNGYHGSTIGGASLSGMHKMHLQGDLPIPNIVHINQPYWYKEGGDMSPEEFGVVRAQELERTINEIGEDNIAAFIAEPIQGAGGVIIPPTTYWPEVKKTCKEYDILFVADEVVCGFGRTEQWFGSDTFDLEPDIMTLAKGITSGYYPLGAVAISQDVASVLIDKGGIFQHGYTYSGHPVACAAALANIATMQQDNILETCSRNIVPYFKETWGKLAEHPLVGESRSMGLIAAIELSADKKSRQPFSAEEGVVGRICRDYCYKNGIVLRQVGDKMLSSPPLIISREQINTLVSETFKSLDQTYRHIKQIGLI